MAEQNHEILRVEHLKKFFPVPNGMLHAVDDISFTIDAGKTLGVVGESGCGKSTMGRAILRLHEPTDGKVCFDQKDIRALNDKQMKDMRRDMQIIFQDPFASLNPRMTVSEAIAAPLLVQKLFDRKDKEGIQKRVREIMDMVGLAGRLINTYPHELDGGRRQRIGIARALALEPKFIVCDEPVSALDVSIQAQIVNLLLDLREQKSLTYLLISHDLSMVRHLSDRILVMYLGEVVEESTAQELYTHPLHPYTKALIAAIPIPDPKVERARPRSVLQGQVPSPVDPPPGCRFAGRCPYATDRCRAEKPELCDMGGGHRVACHLCR